MAWSDYLNLVMDSAKKQYAKGQPYRAAVGGLLSGDTSALQELNRPSPVMPNEALDVAMTFAPMGITKAVGSKFPLTEFEVKQLTAQKNAALPVAEGGLGLPVTNTSMDRAKALGFDINNPAYHGTRRQFNAFEVLQPTGAIGNKPGVYFAKDKSHAEDFALNGDYLDEKSRIIKALLKDAEMKKSYAGTEYIVDNPANIRDVNAAFDPFRRNEADILAGVGVGIPVSSGLLNVEEKKEPKKEKKKSK